MSRRFRLLLVGALLVSVAVGVAAARVRRNTAADASLIPIIEYVGAQDPDGGPNRTFTWSRLDWDLKSGNLVTVADGFATVKGPAQSTAWAGSKSIALLPEAPEDEYSIVKAAPGYMLDVLERPAKGGPIVPGWLLDHGKGVLATCQMVSDAEAATAEIKIYGKDGAKTTALDLSGTKPRDLLRPVAIYGTLEQPKVIFEAVYLEAEMRCALVEATVDGQRVTWRTIAPNLGIFEAGAGTTMTKAGDFIYIGVQEGKVKKVSIATGAMTDCEDINKALKEFDDYHKHMVEALVPPRVYAYGETLIVEWKPAAILELVTPDGMAIEPVAVSVHLAVQGDKVVAEMREIAGHVEMIKAGQTVAEMGYSPYVERGLLFPDK